MGDATPGKPSIHDDDDDDDDDDSSNKSDSEKNLKNSNESNMFVNGVKFTENIKTATADSVEISGATSTAAKESSSSGKSNNATFRSISQGSNFFRKGRKPVFFTFRARQRPRQPFMNQGPNQYTPPPRPPAYYSAEVTPEQHRPEWIRAASERSRSSPEETGEREEIQTTQPRPYQNVVSSNLPQYQPGALAMAPNPFFFNYSYWAPYPDNVPPNVLPCLAHLYKADSLFIIQQINIFDLMFSSFDTPNTYLIQNKEGQVIYYVYETTNRCMSCCCGDSRGFQLHVMDMYNNEVIYMNRPCGCTGFPCCYPIMEVYSPPLIPVGAIMQVYNSTKNEFAVLDADENLIFKIYGPLCFNFCYCCVEVDFTIHALDNQETEVGVIRREWGGFVRTFIAESDMYGITFPKDLDVRIKAVFLGVLFFIVSILIQKLRIAVAFSGVR